MASKHIRNPVTSSRKCLRSVLHSGKGIISADVVTGALRINRQEATTPLASWKRRGWLRHIGYGIYVPTPAPVHIASSGDHISDPWTIGPSFFGQRYIGGWTAANYWELTDQLLNATVVFTTKRIIGKHVTADGCISSSPDAHSAPVWVENRQAPLG